MNGTYNIVNHDYLSFNAGSVSNENFPPKSSLSCFIGTSIVLFMLPFIKMNFYSFPDDTFGIDGPKIMGLRFILWFRQIFQQKTWRFMGIINMMIVIPMLLQTISFGFIYKNLLGSNPRMLIIAEFYLY